MWFRHNPKFIFWVVNIFLNKINQLLIFQRGFTTTETLICPGWETLVVPVFQPGTPGRPFIPGLATGTNSYLLSRLGATSATWLAHSFVPVGVTNRDKMSFFFLFSFSQFFFYFNYTFAFQINLCIGIQCAWYLLIYTYIYIVTYIIFVLDSFHI